MIFKMILIANLIIGAVVDNNWVGEPQPWIRKNTFPPENNGFLRLPDER